MADKALRGKGGEGVPLSYSRGPAASRAAAQQGSGALAEVLPNAELRELEGASHNVKMNVLSPMLTEFFTGAGVAFRAG